MKIEPVPYKRFERLPIGCFTAEITADGWGQTRYENESEEHILWTDEVGEFVRFVYQFFKECDDWQKLKKYAVKYGEEIRDDDGGVMTAINFIGEQLDYTMHVSGTRILIFPYRKIKR